MNTKNKKILRIITPVLILIIIATIWSIKNQKELSDIEITDNPDFALNADSVDLDNLKSYEMPIIIDFGSDSCIPCEEMAPVLVKYNSKKQGEVIIKFIDVWKNVHAADNFPVQVIPTQIFYTADGKPYIQSEKIQESLLFTTYYDKNTDEHLFTVHQGGLTEEQMDLILAELEEK